MLQAFVNRCLPAWSLTSRELESGDWVERLPEVLACQRPPAQPSPGADLAAARLASGAWAIEADRRPA